MKCPYCNEEMLTGYIQCRDGVSWNQKLQPIAALSSLTPHSTLLSQDRNLFAGAYVNAWNCLKCKKIIIDYENK